MPGGKPRKEKPANRVREPETGLKPGDSDAIPASNDHPAPVCSADAPPVHESPIEQLKTTILDSIADIVAFYPSPDMRPAWMNQALISASGYDRAELLSMTCHECWFQRQTPYPDCPVLKTFETGTPHEMQRETPDGRCWYIRSFPMLSETGGLQGVVEVARDITDRKRAEKAFQESEAKYRGILANIEDGYYEVDLYGNLTFFNDSLCDILGYPRSELMGMNYRTFMLEEDADRVFKTFNQVFATGNGANGFEWRVKRKDGGVIYLDTSVSLIRDAEGNVRNFGGITRDVTERRYAEDALRESEAKYRSLFESLPIGLFQTTMDGRIIDANPACLVIFRCPSREDLMAQDARKAYLKPADGENFRRQLMRNGYVRDYESRLWCWDGAIVWVNITAHVIYDDWGNFSHIEGSLQDITERKKTEAALQKSHEELRNFSKHLEAAREQERTIIAREVHDDLGQLLTAIKFDLAWMKRHAPEGDTDTLLEKVDMTIGLVNESLQSVKHISARLRPDVLNDLGLEAAMDWYLSEFRDRTGIKCDSRIQQQTFSGDGICDELCTSMFRIFQEALTNIARHARATEVFVKLEQSDGWINFQIIDNGVGVDTDALNDSGSYGLLGIRERVNAFGGHMELAAGAEKGTALKIKLPVVKKDETDATQGNWT